MHNGGMVCIGCHSNYARVRSVNASDAGDVVEELYKIEAGIKKRETQRNTKKKATLAKKAAPYMHAGLAEPAMAIARGVDEGEVWICGNPTGGSNTPQTTTSSFRC